VKVWDFITVIFGKQDKINLRKRNASGSDSDLEIGQR